MSRWVLILFLFLLPGSIPAGADESFDTLAAEFRAKIAANISGEERADLVNRVGARDGAEAAKLLLEGAGSLSDLLDGLYRDLDRLEAEHAPLNTNVDVAEDGYKTRDHLRARIAGLDGLLLLHEGTLDRIETALGALKSPDAQTETIRGGLKNKDWRIRRIAARAAAAYPTPEGRDAAQKALKDKDPRVVISALAGLTVRADPETVGPVVVALGHDIWVVTVAAAEALSAIGSQKAVRPLIEALGRHTGRVQSDLNDALKKLTGENFEPDLEIWMRWYEDNKERLEGEGAKGIKVKAPKNRDPEDTSYYGIQTKSKRIVYVLDISGSMLLEIGGKGVSTPKPGEEERITGSKIDIARFELKNAIRKLPEDASFNIITFNHLVKSWETSMVKATQANKNKAYLFINALEAMGSTYTFGALKEAFRLAGMGANDPNYEAGVDTIFLLSDGAPTDQSEPMAKLMPPEPILEAVRQWNKLGKIVIHAIAIDPQTQGSNFIRFMRDLAAQNGGQYTERG